MSKNTSWSAEQTNDGNSPFLDYILGSKGPLIIFIPEVLQIPVHLSFSDGFSVFNTFGSQWTNLHGERLWPLPHGTPLRQKQILKKT